MLFDGKLFNNGEISRAGVTLSIVAKALISARGQIASLSTGPSKSHVLCRTASTKSYLALTKIGTY